MTASPNGAAHPQQPPVSALPEILMNASRQAARLHWTALAALLGPVEARAIWMDACDRLHHLAEQQYERHHARDMASICEAPAGRPATAHQPGDRT